jgi:hypothetical protein
LLIILVDFHVPPFFPFFFSAMAPPTTRTFHAEAIIMASADGDNDKTISIEEKSEPLVQ